jgi:hypothetical protein
MRIEDTLKLIEDVSKKIPYGAYGVKVSVSWETLIDEDGEYVHVPRVEYSYEGEGPRR